MNEINPILPDELKYSMKMFIEDMGINAFVNSVGLKEIIEAVGIKEIIEAVGIKEIIEAVGIKKFIEELGIDSIVENIDDFDALEESIRKIKEKRKKECFNIFKVVYFILPCMDFFQALLMI